MKKEKEQKDIKDSEEIVKDALEESLENSEIVEDTENKEQEYLLGWRRCLADFENYKKRQIENQKNIGEYVKEDFILQILPVIDNFRSATEHIPKEQEKEAWIVGIMHIQKQLENILKENGVTEMDVKEGDEFDPNLHEAIADNQKKTKNNQEEEEKEGSNKIAKVVLKGYKAGEKIIRVARVVVE